MFVFPETLEELKVMIAATWNQPLTFERRTSEDSWIATYGGSNRYNANFTVMGRKIAEAGLEHEPFFNKWAIVFVGGNPELFFGELAVTQRTYNP